MRGKIKWLNLNGKIRVAMTERLILKGKHGTTLVCHLLQYLKVPGFNLNKDFKKKFHNFPPKWRGRSTLSIKRNLSDLCITVIKKSTKSSLFSVQGNFSVNRKD